MKVISSGFVPRPYQRDIMRAFFVDEKKRLLIVAHRRAGKDLLSFNILLVAALQRPGLYYHLLPKIGQSANVIWRGRGKDGRAFTDYIPKALIRSINNSTMSITLINGSIIRVTGADNFEALIGSNPLGIVFSEIQSTDPRAWDYLRPVLTENGGWAIFIGCVHENTRILTKQGMIKIKDYKPGAPVGLSPGLGPVFGLNGFNEVESFFNPGIKDTLTITTKRGYTITCTPIHPIWTGRDWKKASEWSVGDSMPIQRNQQQFGCGVDTTEWQRPLKRKSAKDMPEHIEITQDAMYLFGLFLADGCFDSDDARVTITKKEPSIVQFLVKMGFVGQDNLHYRYSSTEMVSFMRWFGLTSGARHKTIPEKLWMMPKNMQSAFLSGYFDGDGSSHKARGWIHCDSVSEALIQELQVLLLNFGIISTRKLYTVNPTKLVKATSKVWRLSFDGHNAHLFYTQIGFRVPYKQHNYAALTNRIREHYSDKVEVDSSILHPFIKGMKCSYMKRHTRFEYRVLKRLLAQKANSEIQKIVDDNYYYDTVEKIEHSSSRVYDFVIPNTHSFFSNGLISHNTPRGHNHLYEMYEANKDNDSWYVKLLSASDTTYNDGTPVITQEVIEEELKAGMPEDIVEQEFYCSFESSIQGAYFSKEMAALRSSGRLGEFNCEPGLVVFTAWDLGVSDSTAIGFFQAYPDGKIVCFEHIEERGEGLEYYVQELVRVKKLYQFKKYGTHYVPHDIRVRELGTGRTRYEIMAKFGLQLRIVPRTSVQERIQCARSILPQVKIHKRCKRLVRCLDEYHAKRDERRGIDTGPEHDWASHSADMFTYFAVGHLDQFNKSRLEKQISYGKLRPLS